MAVACATDADTHNASEYELESILARKVESGQSLYWCKWSRFAQCTWESLGDLTPPCPFKLRGTCGGKVAAGTYFDEFILGRDSSQSSELVQGVDYKEFPSCLLELLEAQVDVGIPEHLSPSVSTFYAVHARRKRAQERARVVSIAASKLLRSDHNAIYLPSGSGGMIDLLDASQVERVDTSKVVAEHQGLREHVDLAECLPAMMSTFTWMCEDLAAEFAERFPVLFCTSRADCPPVEFEDAVNIWMGAVSSTVAAKSERRACVVVDKETSSALNIVYGGNNKARV